MVALALGTLAILQLLTLDLRILVQFVALRWVTFLKSIRLGTPGIRLLGRG